MTFIASRPSLLASSRGILGSKGMVGDVLTMAKHRPEANRNL